MLPVAPPSLDYIPGPEEPQTPPVPQDEDEHELVFIQPHDPNFVPKPIYPEYIPLEDEHILPAEEQPLPPDVLPTTESSGYVVESDPEEYEDDETEDGLVDHPIDGGDDGDDDDGDSSGYDADDEDEDEEEEEEEEEHLAPADSADYYPTTDFHIPSTRGRGERLARCTTLAALPSPPLQPSLYPPPVDRRDDILESEQPPRKRICLSILGSRYEVGESSTRGRGVDNGFADTIEVEMRHRELAELHEHDTHDLYALLEDAQDGRTRISHRVAMDSQRVDLLMGDMMTLQETVWIMEEEAYAAREAWAHSIGQIMAHMTRQGQNPPPPNTDTPPYNMTPKSIQAMIDQALLRNSTNGDGSQKNQVKFATCTLLDAALTWWNGQIRTLGPEAYTMTWEVLKKKMTDKYCPQRELKKLEIELWNLKVKGNDVPTYTNRFQELTLICTKFVANENKKIDKYISGLLDKIYRNVRSSKPRTLDETIELTNNLIDQKLRTYAERADNKRKTDDTSRNNHGHQQQPFKKQNVAKVYNMGTGERKPDEGSLPKCTKCQRHHNGPCTQKCHKCNKVGHFAHDCRSSGNANVVNAQRDGKETPKGNGCFECGALGHFKRDCPKLKNKNGGNRNAQGWVYAVGNTEKNGNAPMNPDSNVVMGLGTYRDGGYREGLFCSRKRGGKVVQLLGGKHCAVHSVLKCRGDRGE
nr:hypothetical protein [Tanacetum cinerariifolium]